LATQPCGGDISVAGAKCVISGDRRRLNAGTAGVDQAAHESTRPSASERLLVFPVNKRGVPPADPNKKLS